MTNNSNDTARWWVREITATLGRDVGAWPAVTRGVLVSLDPVLVAESAPYPDKGHLLIRADQDGVNGTCKYADGHTRAERGETGENGTHTLAEIGITPAERRIEAPRPGAWDRRLTARERELELRLSIEAATGRPIADHRGRTLPCNETGWVYGHLERIDAYQFRVHCCKQRARCPHCARAYGLDQSRELASLMDAALDRRVRPVGPNDALGWAVVVTMPRPVSAALGKVAERPGDRELRRHLRLLVGIARDYLAGLFGVPARELGVALNVHWWASDNPSREAWHWHVHAMIPNVRRDGGELRSRAKFTPAELAGARDRLAALLLAAWPELLTPDSARPNANVRFYLGDQAGRRRWRHRARYDARHPYADVLKALGTAKGRSALFSDPAGAPLTRIAGRIERMQPVRLRRYLGWLTPGRRRAVGLVKAAPGPDMWYALTDGFRRIRRWTERGLELVRYDRITGESVSEVLAELVTWDSQGPPVRWEYRPA